MSLLHLYDGDRITKAPQRGVGCCTRYCLGLMFSDDDKLLLCSAGGKPFVMVLSHWSRVAEQVQQQLQQLVAELVEQHVASVKAL